MKPLRNKNRTHLFAIDFTLFAVFCLVSVMSPPTNTGEAQTIKVPQKVVETVIKYDSTDALIKEKLDSLELNTVKLKESTEMSLKTIRIMKKQKFELHKHTKLIDQIENKLKYDSLNTADENKVNLVKKKDTLHIEQDSIELPKIEAPKIKKKGFLKRVLGF